jgi:polysaccharide export outer membrane protein
MKIHSVAELDKKTDARKGAKGGATLFRATGLAAALGFWLALSGCATAPIPQITQATAAAKSESLLLHPGDVLQIRFPGTPEMDANATIRSDGKITIPMVGDVKVSGLTPDAAKETVLQAATPMLKVKEVTLTVQSSAFIVYVIGAVARPGELISDRALTPFEAVIKVGIDAAKSNLAKVKVIRIDESNHVQQKALNLKQIITDGKLEPFTLKPFDVIYVPEKFSWF